MFFVLTNKLGFYVIKILSIKSLLLLMWQGQAKHSKGIGANAGTGAGATGTVQAISGHTGRGKHIRRR